MEIGCQRLRKGNKVGNHLSRALPVPQPTQPLLSGRSVYTCSLCPFLRTTKEQERRVLHEMELRSGTDRRADDSFSYTSVQRKLSDRIDERLAFSVPLSELNRCQTFTDCEIIQLSLLSIVYSAQCCVENWVITYPAGFSMVMISRVRNIGKSEC